MQGLEPKRTEQEIKRVLDTHRFAVLATQRGRQPHTSLVAYTPMDGVRRLIFATYRTTRKFSGLLEDGRVALFIGDQGRGASLDRSAESLLTAHGHASEASSAERGTLLHAHTRRHPDLAGFLASTDVALIAVDVSAYQLVASIEDVRWFDPSDSG